MKIAILYICTGKYDKFWKDFYLSCEERFITDAEKEYFVFTDSKGIYLEKENKKIHKTYQSNLGWPDNTLQRYNMFLSQKDKLLEFDYIIYFNANVIFLQDIIENEFLCNETQNFIACKSAGYYNKNIFEFPYDRNENSTAFIRGNEGLYYFSGAINGGRAEDFLKAINIIDENIKADKLNSIIALWHDESHWNKFLLNRQDIKILNPDYLYPEGWDIPFIKKIITLDRNKHGGTYSLRDDQWGWFKDIKLEIKNRIKSLLKKY